MLKIQRTANGHVVFTVSGRLETDNVAELSALLGADSGAGLAYWTSRTWSS